MTLRRYLEDSLNWEGREHPSPSHVHIKKYFRCLFGLLSTRTVFIFVKLFACYEAVVLMEEVIGREDVLHFMSKNEYSTDGYFWPLRRFASLLGGNMLTLSLLLLLTSNLFSLFSLACVEEVIPDRFKWLSRRFNPIAFIYIMIVSALYSGWNVFIVNLYEWETRRLEYVFLSKVILFTVKLLFDFWVVSIDFQAVRYVLYLIKIKEADQEANMYFNANDRRLLV
ncbi:hypothetical protein PMAYCL1PPCAC_24075 [Pristionchus mayeri]|uniref:Uncharacterized protein n=1 Tax=Pristionchus mayeri TaxID=1317129 RepID=A0AAN5I7B7_9BILA|nr:hypothetical protein PMAYCL1PPCAC_24075 [Pristionchus mayeri]